MEIITIAGAKGGTAKTCTAHALSFELAAAGYRVTLADCDPQASATQGLHHLPADSPLTAAPVQFEFVLSGGGSGARAGALRLLRGGRPLATASVAQITAHIARGSADTDVVVVDTAPAVGPITIAAVAAAGLVLVPLQPAPYPLAGLMDLLRITEEVNPLARRRALLTLVRARRSLVARIAQQIESICPGLLYAAHIPDDAQCEWAATACQPVGLYNPRARAAIAYKALVCEVAADLGLTGFQTPAVPAARLGAVPSRTMQPMQSTLFEEAAHAAP